MERDQLLSRISIDPLRCFGKPCIRGHRIWVSLILDLLADGMTIPEILDEYPGLESADVYACIAYGAEMTRERVVDLPEKGVGLKLKLDENLGNRGARLLAEDGHDVATVAGQFMESASDEELIEACRLEGRCLVTLDMDFGNPIRYPPAFYSGIVVLRLPSRASHQDLLDCIRTLLDGLRDLAITGKLWIVQNRRVREYVPSDRDP